MILRYLTILILIWFSTSTQAQTADDFFASKKWSAAAEGYQAMVEDNPDDVRSWYRLGVSHRHLGDAEKAIKILQKAKGAGAPASLVHWELSLVYAAAGRYNEALLELENAASHGFSGIEALDVAEELDELKSDERFLAARRAIERADAPCRFDEHHRQFDFWIGDWAVADTRGNTVGHNAIESRQKGCVLVETWTDINGGTGQSINYFDPETESWRQHWVSPGLIIHLSGGLDGEVMRMSGSVYYLTHGQKSLFRATWTPLEDGSVEQHFEQLDDSGETWSTWFRGLYTKAGGAIPPTQ